MLPLLCIVLRSGKVLNTVNKTLVLYFLWGGGIGGGVKTGCMCGDGEIIILVSYSYYDMTKCNITLLLHTVK